MQRRSFLLALIGFLAGLPALARGGPPAAGAKDKCAVCGMFVARHPQWIAIAEFSGQPTQFFCGPKDLFKFIHFPAKYLPQVPRQALGAVHVKDYYSQAFIDGRTALYVAGSDVRGSMGKELIPLSSPEAAAEFKRDHQGEAPLRFSEITPRLLNDLD